jgi:hypothetical protein
LPDFLPDFLAGFLLGFLPLPVLEALLTISIRVGLARLNGNFVFVCTLRTNSRSTKSYKVALTIFRGCSVI